MFNFEQLEQFSRECLFLRKALRDGYVPEPEEYENLQRDVRLLLAELEKRRKASGGSEAASDSTSPGL